MRDPHPANIKGEKVQRHVFKHEIQWGYVVLGLVALVVIWKFSGPLIEHTDDDDERAGVTAQP